MGTGSDTVQRAPSSGGTERRWTEPTRIIFGLFTVVGVLLGIGISATTWWAQHEIAENAKEIERVESRIQQEGERLNTHLQDPAIHHGGIMNIQGSLQGLKDSLEEIKTDLKGSRLEQQEMKTDIEVIKKTIGSR